MKTSVAARVVTILASGAGAAALGGCGQKGPLTLPAPVAAAAPAAAPAAVAPASAPAARK